MPQACHEEREHFQIMNGPVIEFLESRGYRYTKKYEWYHPTPEHWQPTDEEFRAMEFLIDEWDWRFMRSINIYCGEQIPLWYKKEEE